VIFLVELHCEDDVTPSPKPHPVANGEALHA